MCIFDVGNNVKKTKQKSHMKNNYEHLNLIDMKYIRHNPTLQDLRIWVAFFILLILIPGLTSYYLDSQNPAVLLGLLLILGFFIFNLVIRKSLAFQNYFTSRYNLLTTKDRTEIVFDFSRDLAFEKILEVINQSKFKLVAADTEKFVILAISKISFRSWGENIYLSFEKRGDQTVMKFCSVTLFQIYSWGKNEENYGKLFKEIEDSLTV